MKHGEVKRVDGKRVASKEYRSWQAIKNRCHNPNHKDYAYYGAQGIAMCDSWLHDFSAFLLDMGRAPSVNHTVDRVDGDIGYCPSNCRWATREEQSRNRKYAKTKTWVLAAALSVNVKTAAHYIWRVRNESKGALIKYPMKKEHEEVVRAHLRAIV